MEHSILVVEDDPELCEALSLFLSEEGFRAATAHDGAGGYCSFAHAATIDQQP